MDEIDEILPSGDEEYYFKFRNRCFSVVRYPDEEEYVFYAYPRWRRDLLTLKTIFERSQNQPDAVSVSVEGEMAKTLFVQLKDRFLGLDELIKDLGVG
ncbi:hypothetical protein [Thermomonas sp. HDW16]|uniref:hypothetical protein n=1 Tax=Thermomonas sp. HDW16 TaxID=2714945 RepID=UPI0014088DD1|nr:hypothetical protein [Thermomonas sp. HDW16]QIL21615.1 hypothetical protein G7079_13200 [Thermomonas sp. HDW16]